MSGLVENNKVFWNTIKEKAPFTSPALYFWIYDRQRQLNETSFSPANSLTLHSRTRPLSSPSVQKLHVHTQLIRANPVRMANMSWSVPRRFPLIESGLKVLSWSIIKADGLRGRNIMREHADTFWLHCAD